LIVLALALVIGYFGAGAVRSDEQDALTPTPGTEVAAVPTDIPPIDPPPSATAPLATATTAPTSTPPPTATAVPTETPEPTPTPEPVATERPVPPPTGLDTASYIYQRGESGRLEVAFTFDAGEGPGYTAEILDILDEYGIKGSFGVTGQWAEQNPELLQRIVDEGHMLINHTYDHASWSGASKGTPPLTYEERLAEVQTTEQIVYDITGYELAPYFRFPYGDYDQDSLVVLKDAGYDYTLWWTCDTQAWNGNSADTIMQICGPDADMGGPGAIILMHVVQEEDLNALAPMIEAYLDEGYAAVTMEEMVQP